jgi:transposase InsO family protein
MKLLDAALAAQVGHGAEVFGKNFKLWCMINKVPRSTAYRHRKRVMQLGRWEPLSTRPLTRAAHATPVEVEAEVVRLRRELAEIPGQDYGADTVWYFLRQVAERDGWAARGVRVPSRATVHKIMKRYGLVVPEPKKRPKSSYRRFAYARPRDCYQIDATQVELAGGTKVVVFEVLDDCTRTLVATLAWTIENAAGAVAAIRRAFAVYGVPALVLADNGTSFTSRLTRGGTSKFTRVVRTAGARLIHSSPYHPQTCGKVERHHRTFKAWLAAQPVAPATLAELQTLCDAYQAWYNHQRRHSVWDCPPAVAWANAPVIGGPGELPVQHDAEVRVVTTSDTGGLQVGPVIVNLGGRRFGSQRVTVLRDHDHITVYTADGQPIGHLHVDFTLGYQRLQPAA